MRVILLQNDLPPDHIGGAEVFTLQLAKEMKASGIEIIILARKLPNHISKCVYIEGIPIKRIGITYRKSTRFYPYRILWAISYILFGVIECIKLKPNIIHSHNRFPGGFVSGSGSLITGSRSFLTIHSDLNLLSLTQKLLTLIILSLNKYITVPSVYSFIQSSKMTKKPILVIPNGIKIDLEPIMEKQEGNRILFIGRLEPIKGLSVAIRACKILKERNYDFQFWIAGTGSEYKKLVKLSEELQLNDSVYFLGKIMGEQKKKIFEQSTFFLLPSHSECFPISIIEAMTEKLLIIATNVGGIAEMLENGKLGIMANKINPNSIANALETALTLDLKKRNEIIEAAFHHAKAQMSINSITKSLIRAYLGLS